MAKVKIDISKISDAAKDAFQDAALLAHRQIIEVISEPGAFPSTPEDIVDTGALRANQRPPEFNADGTEARFVNTVAYAIYVYLGYTTRSGTIVQGRPWMELALQRMDFQAVFNKLLEVKLK